MANKPLTNIKVKFTTNDIRDILKWCRESGVSKLKFGDLEVSFADTTPEKIGQVENLAYQTTQRQPALPDSKAPSDKLSTLDRQILEDMERSQSMIDDPLRYEEEMILEHINRRTTGLNGPAPTADDRQAFFEEA